MFRGKKITIKYSMVERETDTGFLMTKVKVKGRVTLLRGER